MFSTIKITIFINSECCSQYVSACSCSIEFIKINLQIISQQVIYKASLVLLNRNLLESLYMSYESTFFLIAQILLKPYFYLSESQVVGNTYESQTPTSLHQVGAPPALQYIILSGKQNDQQNSTSKAADNPKSVCTLLIQSLVANTPVSDAQHLVQFQIRPQVKGYLHILHHQKQQ
ncbi:unnamed protein product [Paramecium primaurelia]|uniref:Uncharacterized protein n=1 Tax=Paramecium primaurelia TaxID=5886 RepID=A0A8S1PGK6_PARPR|nr:unnamed protein product [Paramecium primaurelia]